MKTRKIKQGIIRKSIYILLKFLILKHPLFHKWMGTFLPSDYIPFLFYFSHLPKNYLHHLPFSMLWIHARVTTTSDYNKCIKLNLYVLACTKQRVHLNVWENTQNPSHWSQTWPLFWESSMADSHHGNSSFTGIFGQDDPALWQMTSSLGILIFSIFSDHWYTCNKDSSGYLLC